jgi:pimeloyl-ACP methyl ester carboxylesterase
VPPLARDEQLSGLAMPTLVIAAGDDISFPGERLIARLEALVPRIEAERVGGSKHCLPTTDEFRDWLADRVSRFLGAVSSS